MTRRYSSTAQATTLSAACTSAATTIQVTATTGFPAVDFVLALDYGAAGQELVLVTNVAGTTLTVTRGYNSTPASAHAIGAAVAHVHAAQDFTDSRTHEAATSGVHGRTGTLVGTTDAQVLSNKDLSSGTNTFPAALATDAEVSAAVSSGVSTHAALTATHGVTGALVGTTDTQTLTNKTLSLASNTLTGTTAQFNSACTDGTFVTVVGAQTLTNKTLTSPTLTTPTLTSPTITVGALSAKPVLICTSATRPAHAEGQIIYETDTDRILSSNGTGWDPVRPIAGTTTVNLVAAQTASVTVSFGFTFPVAPCVTATSGFADVPCAVSSITTTQFSLSVYRVPGAASISVGVNWTAVVL